MDQDVAEGAVFEKMQLSRKRLKPVRGLGAGQFGMVYLSTFENNGSSEHVAVKMCRADNKHEDEVGGNAWIPAPA
jgi:predicted Ser/Thr protein kinase